MLLLATVLANPTAVAQAGESPPQPNPVRLVNLGQLTQRMAASPTKVLVVNFWATWCRPCVAELPYFEQLSRELGPQGVEVVLVCLDDTADLATRVQPFVDRRGLRAELLMLTDQDPNQWMPVLSDTWNGTIPCTTVVVGGRWQGAPYYAQEFTYESLLALVKPHLASPR
jgi:thiol-disulfide isomerase/thioredoxin